MAHLKRNSSRLSLKVDYLGLKNINSKTNLYFIKFLILQKKLFCSLRSLQKVKYLISLCADLMIQGAENSSGSNQRAAQCSVPLRVGE